MNRQTTLSLLAFGTFLCASAQFELFPTGRLALGERMTYEASAKGVTGATIQSNDKQRLISAKDSVTVDQNARLNLLGTGKNNSGAYMTFGDSDNVSIGETLTGDSDRLWLHGFNGVDCTAGLGQKVFSFIMSEAVRDRYFAVYTDLIANSVLVRSDSRVKQDIRPIGDVSADLLSLTPVRYRLSEYISGDEQQADSKMSKVYGDSDNDRFGFIAQEIREIFPNLVKEDADGLLSVDYIGLIPLMIDVMKDMQGRLDSAEAKLAYAESGARKIQGVEACIDKSVMSEVLSLAQNKPNPTSGATEIGCCIPYGTQNAALYFYDLQGKQIKSVAISDRGETTVSISAGEFSPGMYVYVLIADGQDTPGRRLIITD